MAREPRGAREARRRSARGGAAARAAAPRGRGDRRRAPPCRRGGEIRERLERGAARRGDRPAAAPRSARRWTARATAPGMRSPDAVARGALRLRPRSTRASRPSRRGWPASRPSSRTSPRRCGRRTTAIDHDAAAVAALEERLSRDLRPRAPLRRRRGGGHRPRRARRRRRSSGSTGSRASAHRREADDARLLGAVAAAAAELSSRCRRSAADASRSGRGRRTLRGLGFPRRRVRGRPRPPARRRPTRPAIELDGDAVAFDATGADEVVFRLAPNPGEPPRPLAKIASGGELSRVALAIKQVAGRGRRHADARLRRGRHGDRRPERRPGRAKPVGARAPSPGPVVTHLPQIAAHADAHFRIAKRERDGRTVTEVERLDREGRIVELAAMLGGGPAPRPSGPAARRS